MGLRTLLAKACSLGGDKSGHVAVIAALSIIPILTVAGFAVDYQLVTTKKTQVQFALDSAVIAGARAMQDGQTEAQITETIQTYIDALAQTNGNDLSCSQTSVTFAQGTQDISASVVCRQPTTLSAVLGKAHLDFTVNSASTYGIGKLDVAFVFDSSGSMGSNGRLSALIDAANLAVDELLPDGTNNNNDIRIAMVTYNHMVNAGSYFPDVVESTTYTQTSGGYYSLDSSVNGTPCVYDGWYYYGYPVYVCGASTQQVPLNHTCVFERDGNDAFTAAAPGANKWLVPGNLYQNDCPPTEPLPLTSHKSDLHNYINNLTAGGGTAGHQGVAWGWYLIAPEWANIWPAASAPLAYTEPDSAKALILMTDGDFNSYYASGQGNSSQQAIEICTNLKAEGVVIYSVAFQAPSSGQATLEACSSGPEFYFNPTNGQQLQDDYRAIATSISDLRITQ